MTLIIRGEQVEALKRAAHRSFVDEMAIWLRTQFDAELAAVDDQQLRSHVRSAIGRASSYGIATRRDLALWLSLQVVLGWLCETSAEYGWIAAELAAGRRTGSSASLDRVMKKALLQLESTEERAKRRRAFGLPPARVNA